VKRALLGLAAGLLAFGGWRRTPPTIGLRPTEWVESVELRGEVRTARSVTIEAPRIAGDLQILTVAPSGSTVRAGDVMVRLDTAPTRRAIEDARAAQARTRAEIGGLRARLRLRAEENETRRLTARYDVRRAELEAGKAEILSGIEAQKQILKLADSRLKLQEVEAAARADADAAGRDFERAQESYRRTVERLRAAEADLERLTLRSPIAGVLTVRSNRSTQSLGGEPRELAAGDRVWPGAALADLPDLSTLQIAARVDEGDRSRLRAGQKASVQIDAIPDRRLEAVLSEISPLASLDFSAWPPRKSFRVLLTLTGADERLRPGMTAAASVVVRRRPEALIVPASACVEEDGRTAVYRQRGWGFEKRTIEVGARTRQAVLVTAGLTSDDRIAVVAPGGPRGRSGE
jgi:HlyD family secretion protein